MDHSDEDVSKMMAEVGHKERSKQDMLSKLRAVAELDREIIRVSLHVRGRHQSPSKFTFIYVGDGRSCGAAE